MQQTQEPPVKPADNETFWSGLLAMIRALVLGRRLPPDQLRMFLLFAPPVEYLSAKDVARLLARDVLVLDYLEEDLPENWTLGEQCNECDCCEGHAYEAEVFKEFIVGMLHKEHPEWTDDWRISYDSDGHEFLSYRVLDERGRVHPIACWFEGKLKAVHQGDIEPSEGQWREIGIEFIERAISFVVEDLDGYADPRDKASVEVINRLKTVAWRKENRIAEAAKWIYDSGGWNISDFEGWDSYIPAMDKIAQERGWLGTKHSRKKQLFAA